MSPQSAEARYKGISYFAFDFVGKWASNRPKADKILLKNESPIGRRPIKGGYYIFNCVKKWAPNRPKADKRRFYVLDLILFKNEPQIGRRPIKVDLMFLI